MGRRSSKEDGSLRQNSYGSRLSSSSRSGYPPVQSPYGDSQGYAPHQSSITVFISAAAARLWTRNSGISTPAAILSIITVFQSAAAGLWGSKEVGQDIPELLSIAIPLRRKDQQRVSLPS